MNNIDQAALQEREVLKRSLDYVSDAEAAKHLGINRKDILEYRSHWGSKTLRESSRHRNQGREKGPERRIRRDSNPILQWIKSEDPPTSSKELVAAFRALGIHRFTARAILQILLSNTVDHPDKSWMEQIRMPKDIDDLILNAIRNHPIRTLAMFGKIVLQETNVLLDTAEVAEHLGLFGGMPRPEIRLKAKEVAQTAREAKRVARKYQGQGITLFDVPDNVLRGTPRPILKKPKSAKNLLPRGRLVNGGSAES